MADRYGNPGDWRKDPWWQHDQNPGQGFSAWRGDASDPDWHERYGRGGHGGWARGEGYGGPRGRSPVREDYDRDYGQDFGGGRAYGYGRYDRGDYGSRPDYEADYARPYSGRDWRGFGGRDYVRGRDDFIRYDAFARDWDSAGYGGGRARAESSRRGRYAGRGPKGYRRSDERIREDVNDLLTADPHIDASDIEVLVAHGVVTLSGVVEDRAAKRYAEDLAEDVMGVDDVNNQLKVHHGALSGLAGDRSERELAREPSREATTDSTRKARSTG